MVNKKAYLRTLEAVLAVIITLGFLIFILPQRGPVEKRTVDYDLMPTLEKDNLFRECVLSGNSSCINSTISNNLPSRYDYVFTLTNNPNLAATNLPQKTVLVESIFIGGNSTQQLNKVMRLYYWLK